MALVTTLVAAMTVAVFPVITIVAPAAIMAAGLVLGMALGVARRGYSAAVLGQGGAGKQARGQSGDGNHGDLPQHGLLLSHGDSGQVKLVPMNRA
jgi:hypothetical protein